MPTMSLNSIPLFSFIALIIAMVFFWLLYLAVTRRKAKNILMLVVFLFIVFAAFNAWSAYYLRGHDREQHDNIARAVTLAEGRLDEIRSIFNESRFHLDILATSQQLIDRNAFFANDILFASPYGRIWNWHEMPWLTEAEIYAAAWLLWGDQETNRRPIEVIAYNEGIMTVTVMATPLHARSYAWIVFQHGGTIITEGYRLEYTESLADHWALQITTRIRQNYAARPFWWMIVFAAAALITIGVWVWGYKTARIL